MTLKGFEVESGKILAYVVSLVIALIAVIYNNMASRVKRLEDRTIEQIIPDLIEIKADVKTIKRNCVLCSEENDVSD